MITDERRDALQEKHAQLETKIDEENQRPHPDDMRLAQLKREKLRIKEEMEGILSKLNGMLGKNGKTQAAVRGVAQVQVGMARDALNDDSVAAPVRDGVLSFAAQLQGEYKDNLKDLVYSVRAADQRIRGDLGLIVVESSDQNAVLNSARKPPGLTIV